jgi:hypothetical protein
MQKFEFYFLAHLLSFILTSSFGTSQVGLPYENNFDSENSEEGWSHYALQGSDDWELGTPSYGGFTSAHTAPNAWVTNLDGFLTWQSTCVLETPNFDLTNLDANYALSFHQIRSNSGYNSFIDYSLDNGETWQILTFENQLSRNWQTAQGYLGSTFTANSYHFSTLNLAPLQGYATAKFRFRITSNSPSARGWAIDSFSIKPHVFDIAAASAEPIVTSKKCSSIRVLSSLPFNNPYTQAVSVATDYYFSLDSLLDDSDTYLATKTANAAGNLVDWDLQIEMGDYASSGNFYIVFKHDGPNSLSESNELNNVGYATLRVDTVYEYQFIDDFEGGQIPYQVYNVIQWPASIELIEDSPTYWEQGLGYSNHLENAHSGSSAWHTSSTIFIEQPVASVDSYIEQVVLTGNFDLTTMSDEPVISLWYKNYDVNYNTIIVYENCNLYTTTSSFHTFPLCEGDDWDFHNYSLNEFASATNVRLGIKYWGEGTRGQGAIIDDIYVGPARSDISIEGDRLNRFTAASNAQWELKYELVNSGIVEASPSVTNFYWSSDTIFDASDIFLGTKNESLLSPESRQWVYYSFDKPTSEPGIYYVFFQLDSGEDVVEMREYNNQGYFTVEQLQLVSGFYQNDFESDVTGWGHNASLGNDDWQWAEANGVYLDTTFSGTKAWITNRESVASNLSRMHLYTPIFDFSTFENPVVEFNLIMDSNGTVDGTMNLSYSTDDGATWHVLDRSNESYNRWYSPMLLDVYHDVLLQTLQTPLLFDLLEPSFASVHQYNGRDTKRNTRYILDLSLFDDEQVRFRFNLGTQFPLPDEVAHYVEGALIDDFVIREAFVDLTVDYKRALMISSVSPKVKFFMDIANHGNYISELGSAQFYTSVDTLLDASDYLLGEIELPQIRPDMEYYTNQLVFDSPTNLSSYKYLLYSIDNTNTTTESNELNNIGYWPLALDSIKAYPYFNNFNDSIVDGWNQYTIQSLQIGTGRIRNIVVPIEPTNKATSGYFFTEARTGYNQQLTWYLETPCFNFEGIDSIYVSFDLAVNAGLYMGCNMDFSISAGVDFEPLTEFWGDAYNWYGSQALQLLDQVGWSMLHPDNLSTPDNLGAPDDSAAINASFLRGKDKVLFRYKYRTDLSQSGGNWRGMRLDNFLVQGFSTDYLANDDESVIQTSVNSPVVQIPYSISNVGQSNGRSSITRFYWSTDNVFDSQDLLLASDNQAMVPSGSTAFETINLNYPTPLSQLEYFVFYKVDSGLTIEETDEDNNMGSIKVVFDQLTNAASINNEGMKVYLVNGQLIIQCGSELLCDNFHLNIVNSNGQLVFDNDVNLSNSQNVFGVLEGQPNGVYFVNLIGESQSFSTRVVLNN